MCKVDECNDGDDDKCSAAPADAAPLQQLHCVQGRLMQCHVAVVDSMPCFRRVPTASSATLHKPPLHQMQLHSKPCPTAAPLLRSAACSAAPADAAPLQQLHCVQGRLMQCHVAVVDSMPCFRRVPTASSATLHKPPLHQMQLHSKPCPTAAPLLRSAACSAAPADAAPLQQLHCVQGRLMQCHVAVVDSMPCFRRVPTASSATLHKPPLHQMQLHSKPCPTAAPLLRSAACSAAPADAAPLQQLHCVQGRLMQCHVAVVDSMPCFRRVPTASSATLHKPPLHQMQLHSKPCPTAAPLLHSAACSAAPADAAPLQQLHCVQGRLSLPAVSQEQQWQWLCKSKKQ